MNDLLTIIAANQKENGSFSDTDLSLNSLILLEVAELPASQIKQKLSDYILTHKDSNWSFDKDLMTNFLAISALYKNDSKILDGTALGKILNTLTNHEIQEGGPYCFPDKGVDLGVNIAIAYFLSLNKVELPALNHLIDQAIDNKNFSNSYCPNPYLLIYLVSKFYNGPKKGTLISLLHNLPPTNSLDSLLVLKALKELGESINNLPKPDHSSTYQITLYLNLLNKGDKQTIDRPEDFVMNKIIIEAKNRFKNLTPDLKKIALDEIARTIDKNKDGQMSLIAHYFKTALGKTGDLLNDELIAKAGLANIFFWTAFIIYDDFWDEDEKASPSILPCANLFARHYTDFYNNILPEQPEFRIFFHNLMDKLDAANTWETLYCRTKVIGSKFIIPKALPDYGNYDFKFQPASGQILGPLALLIKAGFKLDSKEAKDLINYFKNYLIAMQINDDAHDLIEDMERGHLSTVVVMLIKDWQVKYPDKPEIDLIKDLEKVQQLFWFKTMPIACQTARRYTQESRAALKNMTFLENPAPLAHFIDITESVAEEALTEYQKSLDLLKEFN